jgi:hypothetical protein
MEIVDTLLVAVLVLLGLIVDHLMIHLILMVVKVEVVTHEVDLHWEL